MDWVVEKSIQINAYLHSMDRVLFTLLRVHDSRIFAMNGMTYNNSCEPM